MVARHLERRDQSWFANRIGPVIKIEWDAYYAGRVRQPVTKHASRTKFLKARSAVVLMPQMPFAEAP